jgi:hypothetical protein
MWAEGTVEASDSSHFPATKSKVQPVVGEGNNQRLGTPRSERLPSFRRSGDVGATWLAGPATAAGREIPVREDTRKFSPTHDVLGIESCVFVAGDADVRYSSSRN